MDFITENEYDLFVRPDTCNPRARFWFHFSVENVQNEQRVIFNVVNLSRTRCLFQKGMTPVVKSTSRPKWQRMPSNYCYFYRSPEHSDNVVLSFTFAFDVEERERYTFALNYPYSFTRAKAFESRLQERRPELVKVEPFAKSAVSSNFHAIMTYTLGQYLIFNPKSRSNSILEKCEFQNVNSVQTEIFKMRGF